MRYTRILVFPKDWVLGSHSGDFVDFLKKHRLRRAFYLFSKETCFGYALHRFAGFLKKHRFAVGLVGFKGES